MLRLLAALAFIFFVVGVTMGIVTLPSTPAYGGDYSYASVVKVSLGKGHGSGFYLGEDKVITAAHVAREGVNEGFTVKDHAGNEVHATVVWFDELTDVGMLKLEAPLKGAVPAPMPCVLPDVQVGNPVEAIGYPLNLDHITTWGHVSGAVAPRESLGTEKQTNFIADVVIAPGSSGGPLFDIKGNVAGITVAVALAPLQAQFGTIPTMVTLTYVIPRSVICHGLTAEHTPMSIVKDVQTPPTEGTP
jgi:S1-C subfamily serine protease